MVTPVQLGDAIRRLRKLHQISQEALANEAKIDRRYMSDIENGKRNVSLDVLSRLADFFGISVSYLLSEAERSDSFFGSIEELRQYLLDRGEEDTSFFTNPDFLEALVGHDNEGRLVYSYTKMVESMMVHDKVDYDSAVEFIDYNTIRTIPYMGAKAPIILFDFE